MTDPSEQSTSDSGPEDDDGRLSRPDDRATTGSGGDAEISPTKTHPDGQEEFLLETVRRQSILEVLGREGSESASELTEATGQSRSTIYRAVDSLEEDGLVKVVNGEYVLTTLGELLRKETDRFSRRAWGAKRLESFLNSVESIDIPTEYFIDAKITRRQPRQPHITIQRLIKLIENSDHMKMLSTVLSPIHVDVGYREMESGMKIEAVFDEEAINIMLSNYQDQAADTTTSGNFTVYVHESLPFELFIFDDQMGMAAHDETGDADILIESDDPNAMEWASKTYEAFKAEAEPLQLPDTD